MRKLCKCSNGTPRSSFLRRAPAAWQPPADVCAVILSACLSCCPTAAYFCQALCQWESRAEVAGTTAPPSLCCIMKSRRPLQPHLLFVVSCDCYASPSTDVFGFRLGGVATMTMLGVMMSCTSVDCLTGCLYSVILVTFCAGVGQREDQDPGFL